MRERLWACAAGFSLFVGCSSDGNSAATGGTAGSSTLGGASNAGAAPSGVSGSPSANAGAGVSHAGADAGGAAQAGAAQAGAAQAGSNNGGAAHGGAAGSNASGAGGNAGAGGATAMGCTGTTAGYKLVWSDEFNGAMGSAVDSTKWTFDVGGTGWGNNELEYYTNSTNNAAMDGAGNLVITAKQESMGGKSYTSARLKTL